MSTTHPAATRRTTRSKSPNPAKLNPAAMAPSSSESGGDVIERTKQQATATAQQIQGKLADVTKQIKPQIDSVLQTDEAKQGLTWLNQQYNTAQNMLTALINQPNTAKRYLVYALLVTNVILPLLTITNIESRVILLNYAIVSLISHFIYSRTGKIDYRMSIAHLPFILLISYLHKNAEYYNVSDSVPISGYNTYYTLTVTLYFARSLFTSLVYRSTMLVDILTLLTDFSEVASVYLDKNPQLQKQVHDTTSQLSQQIHTSTEKVRTKAKQLSEQIPQDIDAATGTTTTNEEPTVTRSSLRNNRPHAQEPAGRSVRGTVVKGE